MKRNKWTEMRALEALRQLEHYAREGIEVCEHGQLLLPAHMQIDNHVAVVEGFINAKETTQGILRDSSDDQEQ